MYEYREFALKRIIAATDFSDASYGALNYAKQLARYFSAKLLLVHVIPATQKQGKAELPGLIDSAEEELQKIAVGLTYDGVRCVTVVRTGSISESILDLIEERNADLLVVGTRGEGYKNEERLGSVAEMLLRAMPCPVLTVGKQARSDACERTHAQTVLFPTDFSEVSRAALAYAEALTRYLDGNLLLLHADEQQLPSEHKEEFQKLTRDLQDPAVVFAPITRIGKPAEVIVAVSTEKRADFIVMGVHRTAQADKVNNYGTAFDVIRQAKCPVFTLLAASGKQKTEVPGEGLTEAEEFHLQQQRLAVHSK
jgi:nucleotide-binding universal stress UspA family protein